MSYQNIASDLLIELSHQQQELIAGSINFQTNGSNFDQSFLKKTITKTKEGQNDISTTTTEFNDSTHNSRSTLSSDALKNSPLATLTNLAPTNSSPVSSSVVLP